MHKSASKIQVYLYALMVFMVTFYGINFIFSPAIRYLFVIVATFLHIQLFSRTKIFLVFLIYFLIVFMNFLLGDSFYHDLKRVLLNNMYLLASLSITYYLFTYQNNTPGIMKGILVAVVLAIIWHTIATAFLDIASPGIVRTVNQQIKMGEMDESVFAHLYSIGMTNYMFPHAIPIMISPLMLVIRSDRFVVKEKYIAIAILVCCLLLVYFSGATGPLLVSIVIIVAAFVVSETSTSANFAKLVFLFILIIPFLLNDELMLGVLDWIDDLVGSESHFHSKVVAFQESIYYDEAAGDVGERQDLYLKDIELFFNNFLWGTQEDVGGHSVILLRMATLGIVGFLPLIGIIVLHVKYVKRYIDKKVKIYYYIGLVAAFIMLATKGVTTWEMIFFPVTVLPISLYLIQNKQPKKA